MTIQAVQLALLVFTAVSCDHVVSLKPLSLFKFNKSFSLDIFYPRSLKTTFQQLHFILTSQQIELIDDDLGINLNSKISLDDIEIHKVDANGRDLNAITNLRVQVFYPQNKKDGSFYTQIRSKIAQRVEEDNAICLVSQLKKSHPAASSGCYGTTVGTIEFSSSDFIGTAYEHIGAPRKVYVADLAIREDARRIGLASRMLKEVEDYCLRNNFEEIYLHVDIDNENARKLYDKMGYIELCQSDPNVISFTESRLQKSYYGFIFMRKFVGVNPGNTSKNLSKSQSLQFRSIPNSLVLQTSHDQDYNYSSEVLSNSVESSLLLLAAMDKSSIQ